MSEEKAPNVELKCNLCGELVTQCCMLSHDTGLLDQLSGSIFILRDHYKTVHGFDNPSNFTMCMYCKNISEFDSGRNIWLGCGHKKGQHV